MNQTANRWMEQLWKIYVCRNQWSQSFVFAQPHYLNCTISDKIRPPPNIHTHTHPHPSDIKIPLWEIPSVCPGCRRIVLARVMMMMMIYGLQTTGLRSGLSHTFRCNLLFHCCSFCCGEVCLHRGERKLKKVGTLDANQAKHVILYWCGVNKHFISCQMKWVYCTELQDGRVQRGVNHLISIL